MSLSKKISLLQELKKRSERSESKTQFKFEDYAFPAQIDFFRGVGPRFRAAVCSRRAGKTVGIAADMIDTCINEQNVKCLYITITHNNVRNIIWRDIQSIIEKFKIECKIDNLRMEVTFPNGSRICTGGAKDKAEAEKYRGWKIRKVYIDECQSMRSHISDMINDVLMPALRDLRGYMYLTGTPGPVCAGSFYEYSHSDKWYNKKWTAFDNIHMHNPEIGLDLNETLAEERNVKNIDENDPSYQRETFGLWVEDTNSLVIKYDSAINNFTTIPTDLEYVIGVDIGYEDSDALAILGYSLQTNKVYVVEEVEKNKQDITSLAETIHYYKNKYNPVKLVMDAGALGKKIQEELRIRHRLPIEAADKNRKFEYLEFLNADLRGGVLKAKSNGLFAQDSKLVTWDRSNPEKLIISKIYHSDIMDAVLYAYRECRHYIKSEPVKKLHKFSEDYFTAIEERESDMYERMKNDPETYEYEKLMGFYDE